MNTVRELLQQAAEMGLRGEARLDAELLLCAAIGRARSYLYAWPEAEVASQAAQHFLAQAQRRAAGEPLAYLTGEREFYGRRFAVDPAVLIPRADTETLLEAALSRLPRGTPAQVLDLGTGSGILAISVALERPQASVWALDRSAQALQLAQRNADSLGARVHWLCSDWFAALPADARFDLILANPPYLAADDPHLDALRHEPRSALVAAEDGLADLAHLIVTAPQHLAPGGWLLLEHGATQGAAVRRMLEAAHYAEIATLLDLEQRERVSLGRTPAIAMPR